MKEKITKFIKQYWWIIVIILIILGEFCWYQIRPSIIYSKCQKIAENQAIGEYKKRNGDPTFRFLKDDYDFAYKMCLRSHGIYK